MRTDEELNAMLDWVRLFFLFASPLAAKFELLKQAFYINSLFGGFISF